jgi:hypothetical protein
MKFLPPIAVLIALVLYGASFLHFYWALGGRWPARDEETLARTVVGTKGIRRMPPRWLTLVVSLLILLAGMWPLFWTGQLGTPFSLPVLRAGMMVLAFVFLARGVAGFTPAFRARHCEEPFATLDRNYFTPLVLIVGILFSLLLIVPWSAQ